MSDDLRTRIAKVLKDQPWAWMVLNGPNSHYWEFNAADALIHELKTIRGETWGKAWADHTPTGLDEFHPDTTHNPNPQIS